PERLALGEPYGIAEHVGPQSCRGAHHQRVLPAELDVSHGMPSRRRTAEIFHGDELVEDAVVQHQREVAAALRLNARDGLGSLIDLDELHAAADPLVELSGIRAERHATVDDYTEVAPPVTERLKPATVHRMMAGHALEEREDRRWHPEQESHVLFRRELRDAVDPLFPVEDRRENFPRQAPLPDQWRQPAKNERGEIANEARGANRL